MPPRPLRLAFLGDPNSVHTRRWIGYFAAHGHLVHLLVTADVEILPGLPAEVRVWTLQPYGRRRLRPLGYLDARRAMQEALATIAPDVLHAQYLTGYGWLALVSGFRPYVITTWGSDVYRSLGSIRNRLFGWLALRRAWLVTADSRDLVHAAIAAGGRRRRTALIQFGVDTERFADGPADDLRSRLGLAGRRVIFAPRQIAPIYRHRVFLEALRALDDDIVAVLSAHEAFPAELAVLRAAATELGVADRVVIVPDIPHHEMVGFYRLADAVVSIPVTDATPVSILEAMAVGRPVVATDLPSVREWLGDLDPDGLVPVDDGAAVVRALQAALGRSHETRRTLALATRARVEERADHERNMRRMEDLYRRAAGLRARSQQPRPPAAPARAGRPRVVLLVAYFFPPVGGVGSVRLSAHARHLPAACWTPLVLGAAGSPYPLVDAAGLGRLPSDLVIRRARTFEPEHLRPAVAWLRGLAGQLARGRRPGAPAIGEAGDARLVRAGIRADDAEHPAGLIARVRRLVAIPDDQAGWIPDALRVGCSLIRDGAPDAIFSSSSPISAHIVAGVLARIHHLPWIAEFRDPWLDNPIAGPLAAGSRRLQAVIEGAIVRRADRLVFVTPSLLAAYAARYPGDADRFEIVSNGYERTSDAAASAPPAPEPGDTPFRLVYAGSLYRPGELATFLAGVEQFLDRHPAQRGRLRIEFVGFVSGQCRPVLDRAMAADRLGRVVRATGYLSREDALDHVRRADAALTLLGGGVGAGQFVGAKLYDYLGLDKQVFAMLPEGDARDLLRKLDWGVIVDPEPSSVADGLERLVDARPPGRRADPAGLYDRARLAGELGRILDEALEEGHRRTPRHRTSAPTAVAGVKAWRSSDDAGGEAPAAPCAALPDSDGSREDG